MTAKRQLAAAVLMACAAAAAQAQDQYPSRPVRIVVPVAPGGAPDVLARVLAEKLSVRWNQPVVVENRPGAALNLAAEAVAAAAPDGHTLLFTPPGPLITNRYLYSSLNFDPAAFVPISIVAKVPFVLVAGPKLSVSTLVELIAAAKADPGKLHFPSPGIGSPPHLMGELLNARAGIQITHVAYKGLVPALSDLLGGHIDVMFSEPGTALPHIRSGKLKALGVGSEGRLALLPQVPAIAELIPDFVATTWFAVAAPPKTSPATAAKVSREIARALELPDVRKKLDAFAATPVAGTPDEAAAFFKRESERWRQVISAAGIKAQ
jgi:tripartite-type tricarboxylate transporter receptor subunit TctC